MSKEEHKQEAQDIEQEVPNPDTDTLTQEKNSGQAGGAGGDEAAIDELKIQLAEQKEKFLRLFAEFENYKKRTLREKLEFMKSASADTLSVLLPILDDFDRAKKNAAAEDSAEQFPQGIALIFNKLKSNLLAKGLKEMETDGQAFDPEYHEAISEMPVEDEKLKGKIIDTIEKGYFLNDKILRHAKVVVGK